MTTTAMPLAELTSSAIHLLCQEIGIVNTARFLNQFTLVYAITPKIASNCLGN